MQQTVVLVTIHISKENDGCFCGKVLGVVCLALCVIFEDVVLRVYFVFPTRKPKVFFFLMCFKLVVLHQDDPNSSGAVSWSKKYHAVRLHDASNGEVLVPTQKQGICVVYEIWHDQQLVRRSFCRHPQRVLSSIFRLTLRSALLPEGSR